MLKPRKTRAARLGVQKTRQPIIESIELRHMLSGLSILNSQYWSQDSADVLEDAESLDQFGAALATGDFDNDGVADLAIGVPGEDVDGKSAAGVVQILYGTRNHLSAESNQLWNQSDADVEGDAKAGDLFGAALAVGDFNRDGFDDLAIGIPGAEINGRIAAGAVAILYGSSQGLTATNDQLWHQDSTNIKGDAESGDHFGESLIAADFNNDGYLDLAIGIPDEEINGSVGAGAVAVLYGSASGLTSEGDDFWHQDEVDVKDVAEPGDRFGAALAGGDFNNDGFSDLAIGIPGETLSGGANAGAVSVLYGSAIGLTSAADDFLHLDLEVIEGRTEAGDNFGAAVVSADFNRDGFDDLATGIPGKSIRGFVNAGAVLITLGSINGITDQGQQTWTQDHASIQEQAEVGDLFGAALATGDFDNDDAADLVIGSPGETVSLHVNAGAVTVLSGARSGVFRSDTQTWRQADLGLTVDDGDFFGSTLATGNFGEDPYVDLAIGASGDSVAAMNRAGSTSVLLGTADAVAPTVRIEQAANQLDPTVDQPIKFTITFSEPVTGFVATDMALDGTATGTPTISLTGGGGLYTASVHGLTGGGTIVASVPAGVAIDGSGNPNRASTSVDNSVTLGDSNPVVIIQASGQDDPTASSPITFTVQFSEPVFGFEAADVVLAGTAGANEVLVSGSGANYSLQVSGMLQSGSVIATIPAGVTVTAAGTPNVAATSIDNIVQFQAPITVVVGAARNQSDPTTTSPVNFLVQFSEPISGFENGEVLVGGTAGATTAIITGDGRDYNVAVSGMTQSGTVTIDVPAGVVVDQLGIPNSPSTSADNTIIYDAGDVPPTGWTNTNNPLDVTGNGTVTAQDVLRIITEINTPTVTGPRGKLTDLATAPTDPPGYVDVNGDGFVTPRDALIVIRFLNTGEVPITIIAFALADWDKT